MGECLNMCVYVNVCVYVYIWGGKRQHRFLLLLFVDFAQTFCAAK